jgi:solute:Na+ symporter, SSS family
MTHFSLFDGSIVGAYLVATMVAGIMVRKYVGKVEDFLVAGREMNLYLGIASLAATEFGIVTCMYTAQNGYDKGFSGATPGILMAIAMLVVGVTGFCIKPLRNSGVMTIPELFDKYYGRRIRWMSGVVIVLGGLENPLDERGGHCAWRSAQHGGFPANRRRFSGRRRWVESQVP